MEIGWKVKEWRWEARREGWMVGEKRQMKDVKVNVLRSRREGKNTRGT